MAVEQQFRSAVRRSCFAGPAFTLIELLVVIAILGVLASLLLPALGAAKARARTVRCTANFQQFAVALQLYAQDHDDALPPNADGRETPPEARWVQGWLGLPGPDCTNALFLRQSLLGPTWAGRCRSGSARRPGR